MRTLAIISLIMLALCAFGQPMPDEAWLAITVQKKDGTPFSPPPFRMVRIEGNARVAQGRVYSTVGNVTRIAELIPGEYEIVCDLPASGIVNDARHITLEPGDNAYAWEMPPLIPVAGVLTLDDKPLDTPTFKTMTLIRTGCQAVTLNPSIFRNNSFNIPGLVSGAYQLIFISDKGYSIAIFNVEADQTKLLDLPMSVSKTNPLSVTVTDNATGTPLQNVRVTLSCKFGPATLNLKTIMTNNLGALTNIPILPPGEWQWTAMHAEYQNISGKMSIKTDGDNTLAIKMTKR